MKKIIIFLSVLISSVLFLSIGGVRSNAYSISNYDIDYTGSFDDFYTDLNGFYLNIKVKGSVEIDDHKEYFLILASSSTPNVIICSSYIFTSVDTLWFEDDYMAYIYDDELFNFLQFICTYLNDRTDYGTTYNNTNFYIIDNYCNSVGYYKYDIYRTDIGLVDPSYDIIYSNFVSKFGSLNCSYAYRELITYIYSDYDTYIEGIDEHYQELIDEADSAAYDRGFEAGLDSTDNEAYQAGKRAGYTDAIEEGQQVTGYIFGLWDTFMNGIRSMFNVDIFGINLSSIIFFVISLGIIGFVLRRIF